VLWVFPSGYPNVYATFVSRNGYSQFVELALPIALWRALREGWRSCVRDLRRHPFWLGDRPRHRAQGRFSALRKLLAMLAIGLVKRGTGNRPALPPTTAMLLIVPCWRQHHYCCWMGAGLAALAGESPVRDAPGVPSGCGGHGEDRPLTATAWEPFLWSTHDTRSLTHRSTFTSIMLITTGRSLPPTVEFLSCCWF